MPFQKNLLTRIDKKVYTPVGASVSMKNYTVKPNAKAQISRDVQRPLKGSHRPVGKGLRVNLARNAKSQRMTQMNKERAMDKAAHMEKDASFIGEVASTAFANAFPRLSLAMQLAPTAGHYMGQGAKYVGKKTLKGMGNAAKYTYNNPGKVLRGAGKTMKYTAMGLGGLATAGMGYGLYKGMRHLVAPAVKGGWRLGKGAVGLATGTVGTVWDVGKAAVKAPFTLLSGANSVRKGIGSLSTMSRPAKAALGLGTAATAYYANEYAQKYKEQKALEQAAGGTYAGLPTEDQYIGKMAQVETIPIPKSMQKATYTGEIDAGSAYPPNIPADTSTPNSNNPEDYADMYDYQEFVNTEGHPDRDNLPNTIESEPRKVAQVIGADIAVMSEINEYTGHPRIKVASMSYREKLAKSQGSKLLGASLVLGGTAIGVGQLNKREGEFKQWKPNYYAQ